MKKIILSTITCLSFTCCLFGQYQVERQVIGSAGSYGTTANHQVSWTVGEVATASFIGGSFQLSQGFQQADDLVNDASDKYQLVGYKFYPNPANREATLELDMPFAANLDFRVLDLNGRTLLDLSQAVTEGHFQQSLDLYELSDGTYYLQIADEEGERLTTIAFVKVH
ncbi:MAG: T9SS type A sorting domain-containing protein [Saprospiraceae bacterium]|nr:T9SS type A sorting domain-containing protein [Saprospiraceae bacterium]